MVSHNVLCCTFFRLYFTCRRARLGTFWEGVGLSSAWTNTEAKVAFSGKIKTFKRKANVYKACGSAWMAANNHNVRQGISFFFCARAINCLFLLPPGCRNSDLIRILISSLPSPNEPSFRSETGPSRSVPRGAAALVTAGQKLEFMRHGGFRIKTDPTECSQLSVAVIIKTSDRNAFN